VSFTAPQLTNEAAPVSFIKEHDPRLGSQYWRLNHLYHIKNKKGKRQRFRMNQRQFRLLRDLWYRNIVDKSRQHGITTACCIFFLDCCLFNKCVSSGIIAHTRSAVTKLFEDKVRFPYENLPEWLRTAIPPDKSDSKNELHFANDSSIRVGTEMRSANLQYLLISEFGKICSKYPEKATEIVAGALATVQVGQVIIIESTAEGAFGHFYEYCERARKLQLSGKRLTQLDWKLFFFAWWQDPENRLTDEDAKITPIPAKLGEYLAEKEKQLEVKFTHAQKAWYLKQKEDLGHKIKSEHPTTYEESFEKQVEGAFWAEETSKVRADGRLCRVPYQSNLLVDTWWDLGLDGYTVIWFTQTVLKEIHVIDFFFANEGGWQLYADVLKERGYRYGTHHGPHDIDTRIFDETARTRKQVAAGVGIKFETVPRVQSKADAIDAARVIMSLCWFDHGKCEEGFLMLENYRRKWNEAMQQYLKEPVGDANCHAADAFQTLAMGHKFDSLADAGMLTHQAVSAAAKPFKVARM